MEQTAKATFTKTVYMATSAPLLHLEKDISEFFGFYQRIQQVNKYQHADYQ